MALLCSGTVGYFPTEAVDKNEAATGTRYDTYGVLCIACAMLMGRCTYSVLRQQWLDLNDAKQEQVTAAVAAWLGPGVDLDFHNLYGAAHYLGFIEGFKTVRGALLFCPKP